MMPLEVSATESFWPLWRETSNGQQGVCFFRPVPPPGWFFLGDLAEPIDRCKGTTMIVTSSTYPQPTKRISFSVRESPISSPFPLLAKPVDFRKVWDDGVSVAIWQPIPPPDYVALGQIVRATPSASNIAHLTGLADCRSNCDLSEKPLLSIKPLSLLNDPDRMSLLQQHAFTLTGDYTADDVSIEAFRCVHKSITQPGTFGFWEGRPLWSFKSDSPFVRDVVVWDVTILESSSTSPSPSPSPSSLSLPAFGPVNQSSARSYCFSPQTFLSFPSFERDPTILMSVLSFPFVPESSARILKKSNSGDTLLIAEASGPDMAPSQSQISPGMITGENPQGLPPPIPPRPSRKESNNDECSTSSGSVSSAESSFLDNEEEKSPVNCFRLDVKVADIKKVFQEWKSALWFAPSNFAERHHSLKISLIYAPYLEFNTTLSCWYQATIPSSFFSQQTAIGHPLPQEKASGKFKTVQSSHTTCIEGVRICVSTDADVRDLLNQGFPWSSLGHSRDPHPPLAVDPSFSTSPPSSFTFPTPPSTTTPTTTPAPAPAPAPAPEQRAKDDKKANAALKKLQTWRSSDVCSTSLRSLFLFVNDSSPFEFCPNDEEVANCSVIQTPHLDVAYSWHYLQRILCHLERELCRDQLVSQLSSFITAAATSSTSARLSVDAEGSSSSSSSSSSLSLSSSSSSSSSLPPSQRKLPTIKIKNVEINRVAFTDSEYRLVFAPLYVASYVHEGNLFKFYVNGQTGAAHGQRPFGVGTAKKVLSSFLSFLNGGSGPSQAGGGPRNTRTTTSLMAAGEFYWASGMDLEKEDNSPPGYYQIDKSYLVVPPSKRGWLGFSPGSIELKNVGWKNLELQPVQRKKQKKGLCCQLSPGASIHTLFKGHWCFAILSGDLKDLEISKFMSNEEQTVADRLYMV